ncbi:MAG: S1 RNA-binding domain-containing protein [Vampirovibrionales bacterium]|nr:S1 RNA-binding domain-containing protein [Vampirovibrionales bacterium]
MKAALFFDDLTDVTEQAKTSFADMLERSLSRPMSPGTIINGEVIRIDREGLLLDIGGKSEGLVSLREVSDTADTPASIAEQFSLGEQVEAMILRETDEDERYYLSIKRVARAKTWHQLAEICDAQTMTEATILGPTRGGVLANIMGLRGFIPASQLRVNQLLNQHLSATGQTQDPDAEPIQGPQAVEMLVGTNVPVKILEVDRNRNKLILSNRAAMAEMKAVQRSDVLKTLEEGTIVDGEIVKIADFGAFVDIFGIDGLLPLSEITWRRIKHPSDELALGQKVKVQILAIDHERQRISLSSKRLLSDPWDSVDTTFEIGQEVMGKVSKLLASGALAELIPGVEAFCPYEQNRRVFELEGAYVFKVMSISSAERRLTLKYVSSVLEDGADTDMETNIGAEGDEMAVNA